MNDDIRISEKVKSEIEHFSQSITQGLTKPKKKFIHQMLFGIQASRDIKLSNISRSLAEDIKLIKTENRLSRNAIGRRFYHSIQRRHYKKGGKESFTRYRDSLRLIGYTQTLC